MRLLTLRLVAGLAIAGLAIAAHTSGPLHDALMHLHGR